jgi:hypothetical protein
LHPSNKVCKGIKELAKATKNIPKKHAAKNPIHSAKTFKTKDTKIQKSGKR